MADLRRYRVVIAVLVAGLSLAPTLMVTSPSATAQGSGDLVELACSMPLRMLERVWRGWNEDRGPELMWFPREPDFVGSGLPHVGAWDYIQHIPMFWYGPGHIRAQGEVTRDVTLADIAPTQATLLGFPFEAPDGTAMREALDGAVGADGYTPPKLLVVMVWDAAGINVLEEHPDRWPNLASLIPGGTWYANAFVGSSPTSTAQAHSTIGTGAFPRRHGQTGHQMRVGGAITTPWELGPDFLGIPTLADLYDKANGNRPVVGVTGTLDIHFGMMGHGAFWHGGDRDIVLTRTGAAGFTLTDEGAVWNLKGAYAPYYRLAGYANDVPGFAQDKEALDRADGQLDGKWLENDIEALLFGFNTPARTPYQQRVIERVIEREDFGADDLPDLLFANNKPTDYVSHKWSMNSTEMGDAVETQDAALGRMVSFLDDTVGEGEWVLALTADHAAMPQPEITGAFQISTGAVTKRLQERFDLDDDDVPVVELVHPTAVFIDEVELEEQGATLEELAAYALTLTKADVAGDIPPAPGTDDDPAFVVAFPSRMMQQMPCLTDERARG